MSSQMRGRCGAAKRIDLVQRSRGCPTTPRATSPRDGRRRRDACRPRCSETRPPSEEPPSAVLRVGHVRYVASMSGFSSSSSMRAVVVRLAAGVARGVARRRVLVDARGAGVVDADDDHRRRRARADRLVGRFGEAPVLPGDERALAARRGSARPACRARDSERRRARRSRAAGRS